MIASEESVLAQVKEMEEIIKSVQQNQKSILSTLKSHQKAESQDEKNKRVHSIISLLADVLLVNSVHENFGASPLAEHEHSALSKACSAFKEIIHPQDQLNYKLSKEGFVAIVQNLVSNSNENVHGTRITFSELTAAVQKIPKEYQTKVFAHEKEVQPTKQPEAVVAQSNWNEEEDDNTAVQQDATADQDESKAEQQHENEDQWEPEHANSNYHDAGMKARKPQMNKKRAEIDDGFTVVPDDRFKPKRGLRGGRGRGGYKTRGKYHEAKPHVQREPYTSHGKRPNWQIGEKRVD